MKILMSRRDEVDRQKAEYDQKVSEFNEQYDSFKGMMEASTMSVQNSVREAIGQTSLNLRIRADDNRTFYAPGTWSVSVDNGDRPHDGQALNWNYDVAIDDDGNVVKETGSWSGLKVTNQQEVDNLKESVRVIEILNNIDWKSILSRSMPRYEDYVTKQRPAMKHFDYEYFEADVEDAIDAGYAIKGQGNKVYMPSAPVWYYVIKSTPTMYTVVETDSLDNIDTDHAYRIKKDTFMKLVDNPVVTAEV